MMEPTLRAELDKALVSTSQNDSGPVKSEKGSAESSASRKYSFKFETSLRLDVIIPICVICSSNTKEMSYDIYTTFTGSSKCLLFDFITKTSNIMFERDKVWSNSLCRDCYILINVLDSAEEKFLTLKNEFLVMLNKNNNVTALCKRYITCQTQTDCVVPSKIEFCAINVKDEDLEFDDLSRGASPLPVSDSDDEPLAKNKDKPREEVYVPVKISSPIKCEIEIPIEEIKSEVYVCIKCKLEFKNKAQGAVHAFTVHRIDIAKEPDVLVVKGFEEPKKSSKDSKKRKSKKKAKRKSYADLEISDMEDFDNDIDWSEEKKHKSKGRTSGKVLKKPIFIKPHEESPEIKDVKPTTRELQKKLSSSSLVIKKVHQLAKPIKILSMDKNMVKKGLSIKGRKSKMSVESANDMLERLQCVGLEVKMNLDHDKKKEKKPKEMLTCTECAATFSSKARLDYHMVKHAGSNSPYICEICGASYKHKKACDIHVGMHKGISPWKCSVCEKIFPSKGALSRHEAIHTGTPNYQCDLCGKSFIHTSSFKMHKLSHSGVKPHSCSKCGLALMTRSHLKRHQRVHSGEKRHECQTCGKKFSERYNLYAHQKSHDPSGATIQRQIKNHDCTVCDATFNRRYILEKHMETAHQRVADTGPKRPRNTMTKLLKQQALHQQPSQSNQSQDSQASVMEMIEVKMVQPAPLTPPIAHNTDSTSSTLIGESSFQQSSGSGGNSTGNAGGSNSNPPVQSQPALTTSCPLPLVAKEELPDPPPTSLAWQGLYQLANDYPLRMHGVDYMGYLGRQ